MLGKYCTLKKKKRDHLSGIHFKIETVITTAKMLTAMLTGCKTQARQLETNHVRSRLYLVYFTTE